MPLDIVVPENNEEEFFRMAALLGYTDLVVVQERPARKRLPQSPSVAGVTCHRAVLALPRLAAKWKGLPERVLVRSSAEDREVIERASPWMVFDFESRPSRDSMHARNSGLNHVLCNLLASKGITVGLSLHTLLHAQHPHRARLMGRMMQNIRLCQKYDVNVVLASFARTPFEMRNPHDLESLGHCLGLRISRKRQISLQP